MFNKAINFNQNIENWYVQNVENMNNMFKDSGINKIPEWYFYIDDDDQYL